ncbi:tyrosine-type recombinase/integrase [Mucilaginibacter sp. BJC16-A38]|uniref:tyrosine-type recombinase/integrase n=1 Tax=Mucilaginibacter phenanthrenivorans TaxID=1234842 RepID=UPI002157B375|nr:tyrosine-type recombinase/integrase [Mucilaginibacter phenanthrenivorans]MCR8560416.1 tyrosine-type recombinase/integrase [Mucilaginibacter phenanthrenivorans]
MLTLKQAIAEFFNHCLYEKNLSSKTIKFYTIDLQQFRSYMEANAFPIEIKLVDKTYLKGYLKVLACWKPKTIKRKIATLKALFNYLEYEDHIPVNPMRKIKIKIKEPLMLPKAMTSEESSAILDHVYTAIKTTDKSKYQYLEAVRNAAVIELLFATGARVSEIADLKLNALNLEAGTVTIYGKGGKQRMIQICNKDTLATLSVYCELFKNKIEAADSFLLINRLDKKLSDQSIRFLTKSLAVSTKSSKKVTPHVFRHTFATLLLENDVDIKYIQALLGHSSIMTTQIYTQVNLEKQKQILTEKHPRMGYSMALE